MTMLGTSLLLRAILLIYLLYKALCSRIYALIQSGCQKTGSDDLISKQYAGKKLKK